MSMFIFVITLYSLIGDFGKSQIKYAHSLGRQYWERTKHWEHREHAGFKFAREGIF